MLQRQRKIVSMYKHGMRAEYAACLRRLLQHWLSMGIAPGKGKGRGRGRGRAGDGCAGRAAHVASSVQYLPHLFREQQWINMRSSSSATGNSNEVMRLRVRSVRHFSSGRSNEKENIEKTESAPSTLGHNNKENKDNFIGKPRKKPLKSNPISETVHIQDSIVKTPVQHHTQCTGPNLKGKSEELKKNPRTRNKKLPKAETNTTTKLEDFDRLQLLKGKLIRKLSDQWLSYENITETLERFPYYLSDNTRDVLLECTSARLKNNELSKFGGHLPSSSNLILLQGQPGTETYQEVLIKAVAQHLQVSLLVLNSDILTAKDLKDDVPIAGMLSIEQGKNDNDDKDAHSEKLVGQSRPHASDLFIKCLNNRNQVCNGSVAVIDFKRLGGKFGLPRKRHRIPAQKSGTKEISKLVELDSDHWADEMKNLVVTGREEELKKLGKQGEELKKWWHDLIIGDHVKYKGPKSSKSNIRPKLSIGQEGFVSSISDSLPWKVCVKFQSSNGTGDAEEVFCDAIELEKMNTSASDEAWMARFPELPIEALCKMVLYQGPVIVYFPDFRQWFSNAPTSKGRNLLLKRVKDLLTNVDGPVVFIASRIKEDSNVPITVNSGLEHILPSIFIETVVEPEDSDKVFKIFKNIIKISPPEGSHLLYTWQKQLEEDKKRTRKMRNILVLKENLEQHGMCCVELAGMNVDLPLTQENAEDVIGWARNMTFNSKRLQVRDGKLFFEKECLEKALLRLKALKSRNEDKMSHAMELAENEYEKSCLSSIVLAHDICVKFDQIGALDDVKKTLKDLIILPLQRPELFRRGNLKKTCKGVLLFGPPGTGKTLIAKAVATEAGANFINVSASSITSKFYGDDEKLVRALFSLAKKLSPAVIFIDEVDSLLGARGSSSEHEATRRIKNEFMACWDGLQSKEDEQILVFATTNRPFDLDDAVIRRLPRRLFIDLPNLENRAKILRIILANEDLEDTFDVDALASQTEGYSGSDLKNLCVAAAYAPVHEILAAEEQGKTSGSVEKETTAVRPLRLEDFINAKCKVGKSVAYDATTMTQIRQWNEQYGEGGQRSQLTFGFCKA